MSLRVRLRLRLALTIMRPSMKPFRFQSTSLTSMLSIFSVSIADSRGISDSTWPNNMAIQQDLSATEAPEAMDHDGSKKASTETVLGCWALSVKTSNDIK